MTDLSKFPVTRKWEVKDPTVLQLFSFPTPNGQKVSIALEELGLPYEAHRVTLKDADLRSPEFLSLNPNNKIPAIIDPQGPGGQPLRLFESGAILIYLADKAGKFLGRTPADRYKVIQWVMWQMGGVGPMFGQLGFFVKFAGREIDDPRPDDLYTVGTLAEIVSVERQQGSNIQVVLEGLHRVDIVQFDNTRPFYCVRAEHLRRELPQLSANNAAGEIYLTDLIGLRARAGEVVVVELDAVEVAGVNTPEQLLELEQRGHAAGLLGCSA